MELLLTANSPIIQVPLTTGNKNISVFNKSLWDTIMDVRKYVIDNFTLLY